MHLSWCPRSHEVRSQFHAGQEAPWDSLLEAVQGYDLLGCWCEGLVPRALATVDPRLMG